MEGEIQSAAAVHCHKRVVTILGHSCEDAVLDLFLDLSSSSNPFITPRLCSHSAFRMVNMLGSKSKQTMMLQRGASTMSMINEEYSDKSIQGTESRSGMRSGIWSRLVEPAPWAENDFTNIL